MTVSKRYAIIVFKNMEGKSIPTALPVTTVDCDDIEIGRVDARLLTPNTQQSHDDRMPNPASSVNERNEKVQYPFLTALLVVVNITVFCYGLYVVIGAKGAQITEFSPISPPSENLVFSAVSSWPGNALISTAIALSDT